MQHKQNHRFHRNTEAWDQFKQIFSFLWDKFDVPQFSNLTSTTMRLIRKYIWIFVRRHYPFQDADSFPKAKFKENCELQGTDSVQGTNIYTYF